MAITAIADGQFPWAPTVEALLNYVAPGQGDGIATFGDARTRLNAAAGLLGTTAMSDGDTGATQRAKINAMIAALGMPSGAVFAYDATTDRIFGGSKSFTRSSTALWNPTGEYQEYATNVLRRADGVGALLEVGRGNKCTNFNANPTDLTGVTGPDIASIVDASASLEAAGILVGNGNVIQFANTSGAIAYPRMEGSPGNLNAHSLSCWARLISGTGAWLRPAGDTSNRAEIVSTEWTRIKVENYIPIEAGRTFQVEISDGCTVQIILNQLEEGPSATTPIITSGATAERAGDELTLTPTSSAALDWHARYDDDSEGVIASGVTGAFALDPADLARSVVKTIWATEAI